MKLSADAETDLRLIWRHSAVSWGPEQADSYIEDLLSAFDLLCEQPRIGVQRKRGKQTYRRWPVGAHAIFYRIEEGRVSVVRILHNRMDERRHLG